MPREYDLTALKPFDYEGRSYVQGECLRTGILGFIALVGTFKARMDRVAPEHPFVPPTPSKPTARKRAPRKKKAAK